MVDRLVASFLSLRSLFSFFLLLSPLFPLFLSAGKVYPETWEFLPCFCRVWFLFLVDRVQGRCRSSVARPRSFTHHHLISAIRKHAIIVPYRKRTHHLAILEKELTRYLRLYFLNDTFSLWVVEQDNTELFNRGWLGNVDIKLVSELQNDTHCIIPRCQPPSSKRFSFTLQRM